LRLADRQHPRRGSGPDRADPGGRRGADRIRSEARRRLHIRQRTERHLAAVAGGAGGNRDLLRDRDRGQLHHEGAGLVAARAAGLGIGLVFGIVLSWSGMSSPNVIRSALLLEDSYLFLFFAS